MPAYKYCDCVYLNNIIDAPKEHHNKFRLRKEPYFYLTSLSNLMDKTLTLLPRSFVNKIVKT